MGIDVMEIGVHLRKFLILSIRISYRSTHKHPLIVGFVLFSLLLYRFLPFLFVFLVSSSPVLVCTFALLGTLLNYGQHPHVPQIDEEQQEDDEISSLKTGVFQSDLVVQKEEVASSEEDDDEEEEKKDAVFSISRGFDDGLITEKTSLIESTHIQYQLVEEETEFFNQEKREFYDVQKREFHELKPLIEVDDHVQEIASTSYARSTEIEPLINLEEESKLPPNLGESSSSNQDSLLLWKKIKDHDDDDDDEEEDDESYNSDSDGAESSSPDASITDIMPMLDELHPLLDAETPRRDAHVSLLGDEFTAASDRSHGSDDDHVESGEEDEHHEDEEDDDEEEEDEEGQSETPDAEAKAVLKWTEDDQKNLMDLGHSELERNQRLESLIARRRARKNFRMIESEKNMIDLDFSGPPFEISPISTARRNPFDLHYDSYMGLGLPPMPGSAPSVMRRNPFDLPYDDPLEERPDLTGGNFGEEFMTAHEKDMHYRRCESFNMGAFFFNDRRQDKQHVSKFRPYFVTEQMASEGLGYSRFSRQISEASESKMSFASETESHSTIANQEDISSLVEEQISSHHEDIGNLAEEQISSHEREFSPSVEDTPGPMKLESELSKEVHLDSESDKEGMDDVDLIKVEGENDESETTRGTQSRFYSEFIALEEHLSSYVHVNQEVGEEQHHSRSSSLSSSGVHEKIEENSEDEESSHGTHSSYVHVDQEMGEHQQHTRSTSQSSSDMHEKIFDVNVDEELSGMDLARGEVHEHSPSFTQSTVIDSDRVEGEDDRHTEAPVYDLSPSASKRDMSDMMSFEETVSYKDNMGFASTSSASSDMHLEVPEPVAVEGITFLADTEASVQIGSPRKLMTPGYEKSWEPSADLCVINENEPEKEGLPCEEASFPSPSIDPKIDAEFLQSDKDDTSDLPYSDEVSSRDIALSELKDQLVQPSSIVHHEESQGISDISAMEAGAIQEVGGSLVDEHQEDDVSDLPTFLSAPTSPPSEFVQEVGGPLVGEHQEDDVSNLPTFLSAPTSPPSEFVQEDDVSNLPTFLSAPTSPPSEFVGYQQRQMVFEDDSHDETHYESKFDFNQESIGYHEANEEFDDEEPAGIEEIDEEFLTELDAVGDFSFEEETTDANQHYEHLGSDENEKLTGLQVLESKSSEGAEDKFEALKLASVDDIDSGFEQLPEREALKAVVFEPAHDVTEEVEVLSAESIEQPHIEPISEVREDENAEFEVSTQEKSLTDLNLELPVLEARSIEDIDSAFRHLREKEAEKSFVLDPEFEESVLEEAEVESTEQHDETQTEGIQSEHFESELPTQEQILTSASMDFTVLEARSLEDIDSAFKQLQEGEATKSVLPEVLDECLQEEAKHEPAHDPILKGTEDEQVVFALPAEEPWLTESNLESPSLKARSYEDIDAVLEQLHEGEDAGTSTVDKPVLEESTVASAESFDHVLDEPILKGTEDENAVSALPVLEPKLVMSNLEPPILEERSSEDIDAVLEQLHDGDDSETSICDEPVLEQSVVVSAGSSDHVLDEPLLTEGEDGQGELTLHTQEQHLTEADLEHLVIETRSVENVDALLEQIHEADNVDTFIIDEPELKESAVVSTESLDHVLDEPMLMETEDGLGELKQQTREQHMAEIDFELPVIEAKSVEDLNAVLKQLHEGDNSEASSVNKPVLKESTASDHMLDEPLLIETKDDLGELTFIEARSIEDLDAVLKQLHKGDNSETFIANEPELKESALPSTESFDHMLDDPLLLETKDMQGELTLHTQEQHLTEDDLELPVIEARSIEDVDAVLKQLREGDNSEALIVNKPVSKESTVASAKSSDHVLDEPLLMETEDGQKMETQDGQGELTHLKLE